MSSYNPWPEGGRAKTKAARGRKAHSAAARIGWAYRGDRKRAPAPPLAYLGKAGLSRAALKRYRSARKTKSATLLYKRTNRKRKSGRPRSAFVTRPFLVNRGGRRPGRYASFVKGYIRRHGWSRGVFKSAARAWRGGARRNQGFPGAVYFDDNRMRYDDNMKRGRGKKRGARRNGVLPYMAWDDNMKRGRGKKRGARRNGILPYAAFNPRYDDNPVAAVGEAFETVVSLDFWKDTVLPLGAGYIGGQFAGGAVLALAEKVFGAQTGTAGSLMRIGSRAVGSAALSGVAFLVTKSRDIAGKVLAGGLVAVLAGILQEVLGVDTYKTITGMSGFGGMAADLTDELKARIAESVRSEIQRAESGAPYGASAFVTTQDLAPAPQLGPGPRMQGMDAFVTTQELSTAPRFAQRTGPSAPPMVADLGDFSDNMADMALV